MTQTTKKTQQISHAYPFVPFKVLSQKRENIMEQHFLNLSVGRSTLSNYEDVVALTVTLNDLLRKNRRNNQTQLATVLLASGAQYSVDLKDIFAEQLSIGLLLEASDFNVFCSLVEPGANIADVGANFGIYAIESGRLAGPDGSVVAFEPIPEQFELLEQNITLNGLASFVTAIKAAVYSSKGRRTFYVAESASFSGLVNAGRVSSTKKIKVSTVALDDVEQLANKSLDLLKIDVEGGELEVLKGAEETIKRSKNLIVMLEAASKNQTTEVQSALVEWLILQRKNGWSVFSGFHGERPGEELLEDAYIGPSMQGNLFLVRNESEAYKKLKKGIAKEKSRIKIESEDKDVSANFSLALLKVLRSEVAKQKNLEGIIANQKDQIDQSKVVVDEAGRRELSLVSDVGSALATVRSLEAQLAEAEKQKANMIQGMRDVQDLHGQIAELLKIESGLRSDIGNAIASIRGLEARLADAEKRENHLMKEKNTVLEHESSLLEAVTRSGAEKDELSAKLKATLANHEAERAELSARLKSAQADKAELHAKLTAFQAEIERIQARRRKMKKSLRWRVGKWVLFPRVVIKRVKKLNLKKKLRQVKAKSKKKSHDELGYCLGKYSNTRASSAAFKARSQKLSPLTREEANVMRKYKASDRKPFFAPAYTEFKERQCLEAWADDEYRQSFLSGKQLPEKFGAHLDERIIEYPWVFSRLPDDGVILDAGSTFNKNLFLESSLLKDRNIVIYTLETDQVVLSDKVSYLFGDLRDMVLKDESVAVTVCISTLEHVGFTYEYQTYSKLNPWPYSDTESHLDAIREFHRVLEPGGKLLLTIPFGQYENHGWLQQFDGKMIDKLISTFGGEVLNEHYYRYSNNQWAISTRKECADVAYFNIHETGDFDPDGAAAARAVCCLELRKNAS